MSMNTEPSTPAAAADAPSGASLKLFAAIVCALLLIALSVGGIRLRNELVALDVAVDTQWQQVENQLERQHELIPKLAQVASRYAQHEAGVLEKLANARAAYAGANQSERPRLAGEVDGVLSNVLALAEAYPDLKADQQFRDLSFEIAGSKNRIALERMRYNEIVGVLNTRLRQLPWSLVKGEITAAALYEPPDEKLADPELVL